MFRLAIAACLVFIAPHSNAQEWTVVIQDGRYFASFPGFKDRKYELTSLGGAEPRPGETSSAPQKSHAHIRLISYFAGTTGTKRIVKHYRSLIVNWTTGKLLGDVPRSYIVSKTPRARQPNWTWKADHLIVKDPEFDREVRVSLQ